MPARKLPTKVTRFRGRIDNSASAQTQPEKKDAQDADHEQKTFSKTLLVEMSRSGPKPREQCGFSRLFEIDDDWIAVLLVVDYFGHALPYSDGWAI
jgi:hypothetical protein